MVRKYLSSPFPFFFLIPFRKFLTHIKQFPVYIQVALFSVILGNRYFQLSFWSCPDPCHLHLSGCDPLLCTFTLPRFPGGEGEGEVAQSCPTLCDPMDCSLRLFHPWDFSGKSTEGGHSNSLIHSSILSWRIPWTEGPGRLQSIGSHRVGHD